MMPIIDFRDELFTKAFRRLIIIVGPVKKQKLRREISLKKAAFADLLLCNPSLLQRFLLRNGKPQQSLSLEEILYPDNIETGAAEDFSDFGKTVALLRKMGYIDIKKENGDVILFGTRDFELPPDPLIDRWLHDLGQLLPLMSKSDSVLHRKLLESSND